MPQKAEDTRVTIPTVVETPTVHKRNKVTGTVHLHTVVHEDEVVVDEPLRAEEVSIERVAVDRWVDAAIPVRQEGDTTIVPVLEEVAVIEKRLKLMEEVRITRRHVTHHAPQRVTLRRQEAIVDRLPPPAADETDRSAVRDALGQAGQD